MLGFDLIMADPPWTFELRSEAGEAKAPQAHYACLSTAAIAALPVNQLARGDCWLWLWATFPMMRAGLDVMDAWGFRFVTAGPWVKRGPSGKLAFGPGYVLRSCAEIFMLGKVGAPQTFSRSIRNVIEAPRGRHSEKPDAAYETAETLFGPATRADLFSRRTRPGWQAWGDQAGALDDGAQPARKPAYVRSAPAVAPHQTRLFEHAS